MSAAIGDDMAAQIAADQREIAEDIEDLVASGFIAEADLVVDGSAWAEDEQIGDLGARAAKVAGVIVRVAICQ